MTPTQEEMLQRYADVTLKVGLGLQPSQQLVVLAKLECAPLVRMIATTAHRLDCRLVTVIWDDEQLDLIRLQHAPRDSFSEYPAWILAGVAERLKRGDAFLGIVGNTPGLLGAQDPTAVAQMNKAFWESYAPVLAIIEENATNWVFVSAATDGWAARVFPHESSDASLARLWEAIFAICRLNEVDPVKSWQTHVEGLAARCVFLNQRQYTSFHYSGPGTDLSIGLPRAHVWMGGRAVSRTGIPFIPNLPTEEVFTCPHRDSANGTVAASRPLSYLGTTIEGLTLTFSDGKVTQASAKTGEQALCGLIDTDQGSCRLGELALVPHSSPVSRSQLIFYSTLLDENAASHLALGNAYRACIAGGANLSAGEFEAAGGNTSAVHVDFMIGSEGLSVEGILPSGASEPIIRNGEWAIDI